MCNDELFRDVEIPGSTEVKTFRFRIPSSGTMLLSSQTLTILPDQFSKGYNQVV
ncbi:MAG: hypothetical protein PWQ24_1477 [Mesotoga sp.]|jgi:hypothetical protein|nr:hypothetical protein [Mesotoga sp.]